MYLNTPSQTTHIWHLKKKPGSSDSKLTEFEVISRFFSFTDKKDNFDFCGVDLPTDSDKGETKKRFVNRINNNTSYSEDELWNIVSSTQDPDIVGTKNSKPIHIEAKGGNKVPNNVAHELGYILMKNIKIEKPMESSLVIPRDRAVKSRNRLTNKSESTKDKAGLDGYVKGIKALDNNLSAEFKVYIVWNDIVKMNLIDFLKSKYSRFSKKRKNIEDLKPLEKYDLTPLKSLNQLRVNIDN